MKSEWKSSWKSSSQPRKQRKYRANAPLHVKRNFMSSNLSKELRKNNPKRSILIKKGDKVKILRGQFKGKVCKVEKVLTKHERLYLEGIQVVKKDGNKVFYPIHPSKVQIIELNLNDKARKKSLERKK